MEKEHSVKEFNSITATICFIYSFMFYKIDVEQGKKVLAEILESGGYTPKSQSAQGDFAPYLRICEEYMEFDFFRQPEKAAIIKRDEQQESVLIEKNIICYRTGAGIYTIKVTINRLLKIDDLNELLLIGEDETYQIYFSGTSERKSMFQIFKDDMNLIADKNKWGKDIWFEKEEKIINPDKICQTPFVYTELELSEEVYKKAVIDRTAYQKELAAILFRVKEKNDWKYIDESYLGIYEDTFDSKLANMHLHSRLFISFHTRSCLTICLDRAKPPALYFFPSLLDTVQLLRCRWHSYVIFNSYLDKELVVLNQSFASGEDDVAQFLGKIMFIRENLASSLEDPITWRRASGSLGGVYEEGLKKFRIESLEKLMIEKMEMLDRLFENVKEGRWRSRVKDLEKKEKKLINRLVIFMSLFFVGVGGWLLITNKETWNVPGIIVIVVGMVLFFYFLEKKEKIEEEKYKEIKRNV